MPSLDSLVAPLRGTKGRLKNQEWLDSPLHHLVNDEEDSFRRRLWRLTVLYFLRYFIKVYSSYAFQLPCSYYQPQKIPTLGFTTWSWNVGTFKPLTRSTFAHITGYVAYCLSKNLLYHFHHTFSRSDFHVWRWRKLWWCYKERRCVCGNQSRYFKTKHDLFLNLHRLCSGLTPAEHKHNVVAR